MVFAQYGNFFSVVLFTLFLIPAIVMNLLGRRIKYMGMILNVLMLVLFLGTKQSSDVPVFIVYDL